MIIGFGFGNLWVSLLMLVISSAISYAFYRWTARRRVVEPRSRAELRAEMYARRRQVRDLASEYDVSDEEIERRIDVILGEDKPKEDDRP